MKKILFLFTIIVFTMAACQETAEPVDIDSEKEAILNVIQVESEYARDGQFDDFVNLYIHDDYNTRVISSPDTMLLIKGWDNIRTEMSYLKDRKKIEDPTVLVFKENPIIKISGNSAWVVCDNIWKGTYEGDEIYNESLQITFLEKINEEWKISFSAWTYKPVPEENKQTENE